MSREHRRENNDITAPITDNDTWNSCPECGKSWKDETPTRGLLHRTRLCEPCAKKIREIEEFE